MNISDFYCLRCSLQFDNKSIFDMHLSIVHNEKNQIKEEQSICKNEPNLWSSFSSNSSSLRAHIIINYESVVFVCLCRCMYLPCFFTPLDSSSSSWPHCFPSVATTNQSQYMVHNGPFYFYIPN